MTDWTARESTKGSQAEHLQKGSENTFKVPSPIHDHYNTTGHDISIDNFSIMGRDGQAIARSIKEAILIRVSDPSLNRNIDKYQLPHIWDEVLMKSPTLKLK